VGDSMGILLGTTLVLIALGVLVYPFISRRGYSLASDPSIERLRVARMRAYRRIADLEGDYQAGDLTVPDYEAQLRELRLVAARIMQQEEHLGAVESDVDALEREIQAARRGKVRSHEGGDTIT
jgi:uncharacterized protein involved in exopolysaccharide biosynthesis